LLFRYSAHKKIDLSSRINPHQFDTGEQHSDEDGEGPFHEYVVSAADVQYEFKRIQVVAMMCTGSEGYDWRLLNPLQSPAVVDGNHDDTTQTRLLVQ